MFYFHFKCAVYTHIFPFCFFYRVYRLSPQGQRRDTGLLLKTLVEAEIDGVAVSNHLTALKDTINSLSKVNMTTTPKYSFENTMQNDRLKQDYIEKIFFWVLFFRTSG